MGGVGTRIRVNIAMLYMGTPTEHYNFLTWTGDDGCRHKSVE